MNTMKKPTALKLLAGNPGKRPLPASEPSYAAATTAAPDWLAGEALKQWAPLAAGMEANGMLNAANREALATYCDVLGSYIEGRRAGDEPDLKLVQQIRLLAREFGFTPSSQASVVAPGKKQSDEKARFFG